MNSSTESLEHARCYGPFYDELEVNLRLSHSERLARHEVLKRVMARLEAVGESFDWERGLYSRSYIQELAVKRGVSLE